MGSKLASTTRFSFVLSHPMTVVHIPPERASIGDNLGLCLSVDSCITLTIQHYAENLKVFNHCAPE